MWLSVGLGSEHVYSFMTAVPRNSQSGGIVYYCETRLRRRVAVPAYRSVTFLSGMLLTNASSLPFVVNLVWQAFLSSDVASDQSSVLTAYNSRSIASLFHGAAGGGILPS